MTDNGDKDDGSFDFVIIGGGIAGVTCVETVRLYLYPIHPNQKKHRAAHSAAHGQPMGSRVGCPWAAHAHGQFAMQMSSLPTVHQSCPLAAHCSVHFMGAAHGLPMGRQN